MARNIIFKYNYCDGGTPDCSNWFAGICSNNAMKYNIKGPRGVYCKHPSCPCNQFYNGRINCAALNNNPDNCDESHLLTGWTAYAGISANGKPRHIVQDTYHKLAVLTTKLPDSTESIIFAVFIIDDHFIGDANRQGYVKPTDDSHRISLTKNEASRMQLSRYYNKPWNMGLFRYFPDDNVNTNPNSLSIQILQDIISIKTGTQDANRAINLLAEYNAFNPWP